MIGDPRAWAEAQRLLYLPLAGQVQIRRDRVWPVLGRGIFNSGGSPGSPRLSIAGNIICRIQPSAGGRDGILSIDNNLAERVFRMVAIGRKNRRCVGHDTSIP